MTTFSNLQSDSVDIRTVAENIFGNLWYVDSTHASASDSAGFGIDPDTPFATLDYAIGAATANNGDVILLAPGHAETKAASGSLFAADVAGIKIVGVGQGADRATFTFTHTGAATTISAASVWLENVVYVCGVDSVTTPLTISAADCTLKDVEFRDAANTEFVAGVITTAAADRLTIENFRYTGDTVTGDACTIGIALVGVNNCLIKNARFHGIFSTAAINLKTTKSLGVIIVDCSFENVGTALTKNVVESIADCTFQVSNCFDMVGGYGFSGSDTAALAADDMATIAAAVAVVDGYFDVPVADAAGNTTMRDVIGIKTDAAAAGAVSNVESLMAYAKQNVTNTEAAAVAIGVIDAFHDVPVADVADNAVISDVVGNKEDAAATGAVSTVESLMAYAKQNVTNTEAAATALATIDEFHDVPAQNAVLNAQINEVIGNKTDTAGSGAVTDTSSLVKYAKQLVNAAIAGAAVDLAIERCVEKTDGACLGSDDPLFTITGGPIVVTKFVGLVTTVIGANVATCAIELDVTDPANTIALSTAVAITDDAAGTTYTFTAATPAVLTPNTLGGIDQMPTNEWLCPVGSIVANTSAANTGVIHWYMTYKPLSPSCVVAAAA